MLGLLLSGLRYVYKHTIKTPAHGVRHQPGCSENTPPLTATALSLTISPSTEISDPKRRPTQPRPLPPLRHERVFAWRACAGRIARGSLDAIVRRSVLHVPSQRIVKKKNKIINRRTSFLHGNRLHKISPQSVNRHERDSNHEPSDL